MSLWFVENNHRETNRYNFFRLLSRSNGPILELNHYCNSLSSPPNYHSITTYQSIRSITGGTTKMSSNNAIRAATRTSFQFKGWKRLRIWSTPSIWIPSFTSRKNQCFSRNFTTPCFSKNLMIWLSSFSRNLRTLSWKDLTNRIRILRRDHCFLFSLDTPRKLKNLLVHFSLLLRWANCLISFLGKSRRLNNLKSSIT